MKWRGSKVHNHPTHLSFIFPKTADPIMFYPLFTDLSVSRLSIIHSRWRDCSVALLSCCVPNLSFYSFAIHLDASSSELYTDGALALQVELVAREAGQQVALPDSGVSDQHHCGGFETSVRWKHKLRKRSLVASAFIKAWSERACFNTGFFSSF